ncbi:hypothetical protein RN001_014566 [Aquatica leii]|uniref:Caspase-1 n=1 Tax=Aquatica leii TaxID=1421715 RepID=A0AAN7SBI2_9COLE|nr:hypothetical protein RN001_014566 [Aquatica leii]
MTDTDAIGFFSKFKREEEINGSCSEPYSELTEIDEDSDYYNMNHFRRGTAIIFNHYKFDEGLIERKGTMKDARDLKSVLKDIKFDVTIYHDLKFGAIYDVIINLSKRNHSDADCLLIAVLTHGSTGKIHARDHEYSPDILWKFFAGDKCPTLAGKPKLFFIQACRGDEIDDGTRIRNILQMDSKKIGTYTIPVMSDILVMFSCFDGYLSWRSPQTGSWFIQCLCSELKSRVRKNDLLTILTFLNRKMAVTYKSIVKEAQGTKNYICETKEGHLWRRHIDQIINLNIQASTEKMEDKEVRRFIPKTPSIAITTIPISPNPIDNTNSESIPEIANQTVIVNTSNKSNNTVTQTRSGRKVSKPFKLLNLLPEIDLNITPNPIACNRYRVAPIQNRRKEIQCDNLLTEEEAEQEEEFVEELQINQIKEEQKLTKGWYKEIQIKIYDDYDLTNVNNNPPVTNNENANNSSCSESSRPKRNVKQPAYLSDYI